MVTFILVSKDCHNATTYASSGNRGIIQKNMEDPDGKSDFGTYHAPAGRADHEEILKSYDQLAANEMIALITDAMPDVAVILNGQRQVVYSNKMLMNLIGDAPLKAALGSRPGEFLNCLNAGNAPSGCGTGISCRYCGAVNAILECQRTGQQSQSECRISSHSKQADLAYDLLVTAKPFRYAESDYIILTIKDISDQKRRRMLERMFFHDVLNTASGLNGMLLALKEASGNDELSEYIDIAGKASNDLIEELLAQRALAAAENGDLQINVTRCSNLQLIHDVAAYLSHHEIAEGKRILVDPFSHAVQIETDPQLLKRVLLNLVKNALEASQPGDNITMGSKIGDTSVRFWVNNPGRMSEEVQSQIFQRSFSTKGAERGIGSYSVKLLTTKYLKGSVEFTSDERYGTTFQVELPLGI